MISNNRIVIFVLIFLANTGYGVILPGLALYAASLGSSYSIIGAMVSIYAAAQLITQIPVGKVSDRIGRKRFIVAGFAGVTLAAVLYNFASQPWHFFALQTLGGLSIGCVWPPLLAQLTDETQPHERGRVMGIYNTIFFLGVGLGPLVGGFVTRAFGFLAVFGLWAFIAGAGALFGLVAFKELRGRAPVAATPAGPRTRKPVLLKEGAFLSFMGACAMRSRGGFCTSFNNAILPLYVVALFSVSESMVGALMFAHGIMLAVFNFPGGLVSDRFGRKWPPIYGSLIATAGVLWYSFPGGYWTLLIAVALAGAGSAFATPALQALVGDVSTPSRRGEAFGYFQTSFYVGTVFGAAVFGFMADLIGLWWATLSWAGFSLALSLAGLAIGNTVARPEPATAPQRVVSS
ncbi:MAG: MFS transporter [Chloroflexi bacterium]|nr:MFS transporter [Chloroflexota bacterium]